MPRLLRLGYGATRFGVNMKIKLRNSKSKRAKMTGFRTRQKTAGGRKVNKRQRARRGSI